jgi:hypothetical protein
MEKEFVPYELALRMKALNFDEPCLAGYSTSSGNLEHYSRPLVTKDSFTVDASTWQSAFRWFREKYHIIGEVKFKGGKTTKTAWYDYLIYSEIDWDDKNPNEQWKTYEEAELECLTNLIEIVEQNKSE